MDDRTDDIMNGYQNVLVSFKMSPQKRGACGMVLGILSKEVAKDKITSWLEDLGYEVKELRIDYE